MEERMSQTQSLMHLIMRQSPANIVDIVTSQEPVLETLDIILTKPVTVVKLWMMRIGCGGGGSKSCRHKESQDRH